MLIEPNTNIRLLRNVPLDDTYEHTIYFASASSQTRYFQSLTKYSLQNQSYQRVQRGRARVGIKADSIYDCNYMMFQNTSYGNKWFYAFITRVEYVNDITSEVDFEIDVMQTWFFDYESQMCFVEREHVEDDTIGHHIEDEPVALGEYVMNGYDPVLYLQDMAVILAIIDVDGDNVTEGNLYDGVFGGAELWAYESTDVQGIIGKIGEYVQKPDAIVGMYMCPLLIIDAAGKIPEGHKLSYGAGGIKHNRVMVGCSTAMTLQGYKPKNNKLYTYPYNFYHVDNASGAGLSLRYEFFDALTPVLEISGTITQPVEVTLRPCSYKGVRSFDQLGGYTTLNTESLTLSGYPLCSWNYDAFQAWVAQNSVPLALNTLANIGEIAISAQYGNASGASIAAGLVGQAASVLSTIYKASIATDISKGNFNNGGANVANHKQAFYGGQCSINSQQAEMIDEFFDMFGYGVKRLKVPNVSARPHWNYVKTDGWCGRGSVPADDMKKIAGIYNAGITFWKNGSEVGNYSLDNSLH